jgi:ribonuclease HII
MPLDQTTARQYGYPIAGIDEVGMGPWAGPICACALVLNLGASTNIRCGHYEVDDSKKMTRNARKSLAPLIKAASTYGLGWVDPQEIEIIHNIQKAGYLARDRAVAMLLRQGAKPSAILSDYFEVEVSVAGPDGRMRRIPCVHEAKADGKSFVVACASIVAKVERDELMAGLHRQFPGYGWAHNAGYGTPEHREGIRVHGLTAHHRQYIVQSAMRPRTGWDALGRAS